MKPQTLRDLLGDELKDLFSAENQLVKALPKMAKAATNEELRSGFQEHLEQTRGQVERLERACELLGINPKGKKCKAMEGLVEEGQELISEGGTPAVLDAGLIAAAQKVEHYEMAGYGSARAWAEQLGLEEVAQLLRETFEEEKATDEKLTTLAEETVNSEAEQGDGADGEEEEPAAKKSASRTRKPAASRR